MDLFIGTTYNQLCPIEALMAYIAVRGQEEGLFFRFKNNRLLTKGRFVTGIRDALTAAGIDASHSFRIGAAITAAKNGVSADKIQTLG